MAIGTVLIADQDAVDQEEVRGFAEALTLAGVEHIGTVAEGAPITSIPNGMSIITRGPLTGVIGPRLHFQHHSTPGPRRRFTSWPQPDQ